MRMKIVVFVKDRLSDERIDKLSRDKKSVDNPAGNLISLYTARTTQNHPKQFRRLSHYSAASLFIFVRSPTTI